MISEKNTGCFKSIAFGEKNAQYATLISIMLKLNVHDLSRHHLSSRNIEFLLCTTDWQWMLNIEIESVHVDLLTQFF